MRGKLTMKILTSTMTLKTSGENARGDDHKFKKSLQSLDGGALLMIGGWNM